MPKDVQSCLSSNGYDDSNTSSTASKTAVNACAAQITTCMSVSGYTPKDGTKLTLRAMNDWVSSISINCPAGTTLVDDGITTKCVVCPTGLPTTDQECVVLDVPGTTYQNANFRGYISIDGTKHQKDTNYSLTKNGTWAAEIVNGSDASAQNVWGTVYGTSICSTTAGTSNATGNPNETISGGYCWCKMTAYKSTDGVTKTFYSAPWVFHSNKTDVATCEGSAGCAGNCAAQFQTTYNFRKALLGQ